MSKLILFLVVVCLIALVLFLSYKMDKNEVSKKRKEKIIKNNKNNDIDEEIYKDIYNMVKDSLSVDEDETNISDINQETMQIDTNQIRETIEKNNNFDNNLEDKILSDYLEILDEADLNIEENNIIEENVSVENISNNELVNEEKEEVEPVNNYIEEIEVENIKEPEIDETNKIDEELKDEVEEEIYYNDSDENLNEFTMIFNSKLLRSTEEILEDDEDSELKDLENEIAEANIKKYTRNKKGLPKLVSKKANSEVSKKTDNNVKRYTRKKPNDKKKVEENSPKVKRYTRKKVINLNKENSELLNLKTTPEIKETTVKDDKPKLKRGRPKKIDKPKRGRPKKVEVAKRGRPKKEEKPKRGRPKKIETTSKSKKTTTTNKN